MSPDTRPSISTEETKKLRLSASLHKAVEMMQRLPNQKGSIDRDRGGRSDSIYDIDLPDTGLGALSATLMEKDFYYNCEIFFCRFSFPQQTEIKLSPIACSLPLDINLLYGQDSFRYHPMLQSEAKGKTKNDLYFVTYSPDGKGKPYFRGIHKLSPAVLTTIPSIDKMPPTIDFLETADRLCLVLTEVFKDGKLTPKTAAELTNILYGQTLNKK